MKDILLIDKPAGITSFDVIRKLRQKMKIRKMGHAGTLDPMATGLMIVGVREGTKKLNEYLKLPKVYEAEVMLGIRTDTGDREGKILESSNVKFQSFKEGEIRSALELLRGKIVLPVPKYSAVKMRGTPLYARARKGEDFEAPKKEMEVMRITLERIWNMEYGMKNEGMGIVLKFEVEVASGTYIRSLAEEIGRRLGVPATLWNLRRTQIGQGESALKIEDAEKSPF
ncbi:MAG: tRNA pseudouridine(55) synthase TruB [Patescibacteria group bacterium]|nr:tRNA pseudouridine(55) synthase TruB [Patescibacteria group bacterium]